jgi:hypothetical protein
LGGGGGGAGGEQEEEEKPIYLFFSCCKSAFFLRDKQNYANASSNMKLKIAGSRELAVVCFASYAAGCYRSALPVSHEDVLVIDAYAPAVKIARLTLISPLIF